MQAFSRAQGRLLAVHFEYLMLEAVENQGIVQDFMKKVEAALDGAAFPYDLEFALRVANQLSACKAQRSA